MSAEGAAAELPRVALYHLATGHYLSNALHLAVKLGIPELLKDGARPARELAEATATHVPSLHRVMRLLASAGVFEEQEDGSFGLTPLGECLPADAPGSVRSMVLLYAGDRLQDAWQELEYCVRTGNPVFRKWGLDHPFADQAGTAEAVARFDAAMAALTARAATAIAEAYDFAPLRQLVDVGGGNGALLLGLLEAHPHLRGIVFDRPAAAERARQQIAGRALAHRCEAVGGDFFEDVPRGADAYILKHVVHNWDDDAALAFLKNCHRAMADHGRLLIVEDVYPRRIDQSVESRGAAANDVNLLVSFGGRQRSEAEFRRLYEAAGFKLARIVPTQAWVSVIEGLRA